MKIPTKARWGQLNALSITKPKLSLIQVRFPPPENRSKLQEKTLEEDGSDKKSPVAKKPQGNKTQTNRGTHLIPQEYP